MKKIMLLLLFTVPDFARKKPGEKKKETEELTSEPSRSRKAHKADFIDSNGALVLMGTNFIYGVKRNEMADQLSKQVAAVKKNDFDMVNVIVRGTVSKNTDSDSEWEEVITINEIMRVSDKPSEVDIKFDQTEKKN